jgi:DNA-binding NarL/FixJ family response regulator
MASSATQALSTPQVTTDLVPAATAKTTVTPTAAQATASAAPTVNQAPQPSAQSALPQDTVTISPQAQAIASAANAALTSSTTLSSQAQAQLQVLITQGWSLNQIASNLNVSVTTVEQYLSTAQISALPI